MLQRLRTESKKRGVFLKVNTEEGFEIQKGALKKLLNKAKDTSFGQYYGFHEI